MRPRERLLVALRGGRPDRTPTACVAALTPVELQEKTGCRMPDVHLDPEQLVRLSAANHEVLGFDGVSFVINYFNEPAALGAPMEWGSPTVLPRVAAHPWASAEDARAPRDLLLRKPLSTNLEALRIAKDRYGSEVAVLAKVMGPLSMTQVMHGVEGTMLGLCDEPDGIRRFLEACVDILALTANAQLDAGADAILIGEGGAGAQMLSPSMYDRFLLDPHRRLIEAIHGPTILHMCGDITPRLSSLSRLGMSCFNFDWAIEPSAMKEAAAGRYAIMGNVSTTDLLLAGPEAIEKQVFACLEAGVDVVSPGCAVSPQCPVRNFQALTRAAEGWTARGGAATRS